MTKRNKINTVRISATLPLDMVEDFKAKSEASGVSISRLIYLRLKTKKNIIVVSKDVSMDIKALRQVLDKIAAERSIDTKTIDMLQRQVQFYEALVTSGREEEVYVS